MYVGIDVSKAELEVAVADDGAEPSPGSRRLLSSCASARLI